MSQAIQPEQEKYTMRRAPQYRSAHPVALVPSHLLDCPDGQALSPLAVYLYVAQQTTPHRDWDELWEWLEATLELSPHGFVCDEFGLAKRIGQAADELIAAGWWVDR
jgi:hypothetical protein